MIGIHTAKSLSEYDVIQVSDHTGDRQVIARWLMDANLIDTEEWSVARAKELNADLDKIVGGYVVREKKSGQVVILPPDTFEENFSLVIEDPLDALDKEFDSIEIPEEIKERGEFQTEEQWQYRDNDGSWWDAHDEQNARTRSANANNGFDSDPAIRVRTQIVATGAWTER